MYSLWACRLKQDNNQRSPCPGNNALAFLFATGYDLLSLAPRIAIRSMSNLRKRKSATYFGADGAKVFEGKLSRKAFYKQRGYTTTFQSCSFSRSGPWSLRWKIFQVEVNDLPMPRRQQRPCILSNSERQYRRKSCDWLTFISTLHWLWWLLLR